MPSTLSAFVCGKRRVLLALAGCVVILMAQAWGGDLQDRLNSELKGKILTQRKFAAGRKVTYEADGTPALPVTIGSWTTDGEIRVAKIAVRSNALEIEGERLLLISGSGNTKFVDFFEQDTGLRKFLGAKDFKKLRDKQQVEISIIRPEGFDEASAHQALAKIFLTAGEKLSDFVPDYWKPGLRAEEGTPEPPSTAPAPYKVGVGIKPPRARYSPDPEYSEIARQIRYQGTVVLWMTVDKTGAVHDLRITRALGAGLDEEAVKAVQKWAFFPATKDGEPVPVQINVEVNFRLY